MTTTEYDNCMKRGKIKPFSRGKALCCKELETAAHDLEVAEKTLADENYKWATIQIYYSMFHSCRALLYAKNLQEHSHHCLLEAINALYVKPKIISPDMLALIREAKALREEADYYNRWSEQGCRRLMVGAREVYDRAKAYIDKHE